MNTIANKINKLLRVSKSTLGNKHERASAYRFAKKLAEKYDITIEEVEDKDVFEATSKDIEGKKPKDYTNSLAHHLAYLFDCQVYISISIPQDNKHKSIYRFIFVGEFRVGCQMCKNTFDTLMMLLVISRNRYNDEISCIGLESRILDIFAFGWCQGVIERNQKAQKDNTDTHISELNSTSGALTMLKKNMQTKTHIKNKITSYKPTEPKKTNINSYGIHGLIAYQVGLQTGMEIDINSI